MTTIIIPTSIHSLAIQPSIFRVKRTRLTIGITLSLVAFSIISRSSRLPSRHPNFPRNIGLPFRFSTYAPFSRRSGPYGAFLGHGYDPVWTEFDGKATKSVNRVSFFRRLAGVDVQDPYLGITPESRLRISKAAQRQQGVTLDRFDKRRTLLQQLDDEQRRFEKSSSTRSHDRFREMAYSLITSEKLREALDLGTGTPATPRSIRHDAVWTIGSHSSSVAGGRMPSRFGVLG